MTQLNYALFGFIMVPFRAASQVCPNSPDHSLRSQEMIKIGYADEIDYLILDNCLFRTSLATLVRGVLLLNS